MSKALLAVAAVGATVVPVARADSLVVAAPGARNLTGGAGYLAWSAPAAAGRWRLTIRAPDGTVSQPHIATFAQPPQPSIGTSARYGPERRLVAVYTRAGDVYALDLKKGTERRLAGLSSRADETLAAVNAGQYVVVRKGAHGGMFFYPLSGKARRITPVVPSQIFMAVSRVASIEGTAGAQRVVVRVPSGRGAAAIVPGTGLTAPGSLWLTRYRVGWATHTAPGGTSLFGTTRFLGSGAGTRALSIVRDPWTSPSRLYGVALGRSLPEYYLDDQGVELFTPLPFQGV